MTRYLSKARWAVAVVSLLLAGAVQAQVDKARQSTFLAVDPAAQKVAENSLSVFKKMVDDATHQEMGFRSLAEVSQISLGVPIPVHFIWVKNLKPHDPTLDPHVLLHNVDELIYPIEVMGETRSSITIRKEGGTWQLISLGSATHIQEIENLRQQHMAANGKQPRDYFIVAVPEMYQKFLAHYDPQGSLRLTNIWDHNQLQMKSNVTESAQTVVKILQAALPTFRFGLPKR